MNEHPDYVSTYVDKVDAAKRFVLDTVNEAVGAANLMPIFKAPTKAHAAAEAAEVVKGALQALVDRGMPYGIAVDKLRRLDLTPNELERLAKSGKKQPKVRYDTNGSGSASNDDREPDDDADEKLDKMAIGIQLIHPGNLTKAQALVWAAERTEEGRELMRLSKRRSIGRYGEQAAGHFDKAESPAPTLNSADFDKCVTAVMKLEGISREMAFDRVATEAFGKMGDHSVPRPARGEQGTHTGENQRSWQHSGRDGSHSQENARPVQDQSAVANTDAPPKPKVRRDSADAADFDAGNARVSFAVRLKELQKTGLNFDQAASKAMREAGINPQPISP